MDSYRGRQQDKGGKMAEKVTPDDEVGGHREVEEETCMSDGGRWTEPQWGGSTGGLCD